jgi:NAD(P)-dependent dehydrogenase (short-subunit alcohol dehydrogenase family)
MVYKNPFDLTGKTSFITGAGSGLGRAICQILSENGSDIVCVDLNKVSAEETAHLAQENGTRAIALQGDVSNPEDVASMFTTTKREFGKLDVLFNNAGITTRGGRLHELPLEQWDKVIRVDLTGVFLCMKEGIKLMLDQENGSIINMSSTAAVRAVLLSKSHYSVAKAGVISLTKVAAKDYGPDGIRINAIAPGMFGGTKLGESGGNTKEEQERLLQLVSDKTPLRRVAEPHELKGLALYLASDASSFVTGSVFIIDGGESL